MYIPHFHKLTKLLQHGEEMWLSMNQPHDESEKAAWMADFLLRNFEILCFYPVSENVLSSNGDGNE